MVLRYRSGGAEPRPETTLVELIRYNNWANAQVFAACQKLTAGQLAAAAPGVYGTIRDTLEHIIRAEADYVGRLTGDRSPKWMAGATSGRTRIGLS